jgi:hypothetical protein
MVLGAATGGGFPQWNSNAPAPQTAARCNRSSCAILWEGTKAEETALMSEATFDPQEFGFAFTDED